MIAYVIGAMMLILLLLVGLPLRQAVSLGLVAMLGLIVAFKLLKGSIYLAFLVVAGVLVYGFIIARRHGRTRS